MGDTLAEVERALQAIEELDKVALPIAESVFPSLAAINPFLPFFKVVLDGLNVVHQATGKGLPETLMEATDHNTPGQLNSPSLS